MYQSNKKEEIVIKIILELEAIGQEGVWSLSKITCGTSKKKKVCF